jgi:hypothetical protein
VVYTSASAICVRFFCNALIFSETQPPEACMKNIDLLVMVMQKAVYMRLIELSG